MGSLETGCLFCVIARARMCQGTFIFIHDNRILAGVHSIVAVEERKESKWIRIL